MRLVGKLAIVTGGGQGIGRAIALALAKEGADVSIFDVNLELAKKVADEIKTLGRQAVAIKCDVANSKDVDQAADQVLDTFRKVDILVNNAGINEPALVEETTEAMWDTIIAVNLKGQFLCSQAIGRQMIKQRHGKIVNIASTTAHVAAPYLASYGASKGGVLALTRALAVEWARYNINVNAVSPGMTETALDANVDKKAPGLGRERVTRIPLRRPNKPEDVANAVLFLASAESDNITGQAIIVDCGVCALHSTYLWPN